MNSKIPKSGPKQSFHSLECISTTIIAITLYSSFGQIFWPGLSNEYLICPKFRLLYGASLAFLWSLECMSTAFTASLYATLAPYGGGRLLLPDTKCHFAKRLLAAFWSKLVCPKFRFLMRPQWVWWTNMQILDRTLESQTHTISTFFDANIIVVKASPNLPPFNY